MPGGKKLSAGEARALRREQKKMKQCEQRKRWNKTYTEKKKQHVQQSNETSHTNDDTQAVNTHTAENKNTPNPESHDMTKEERRKVNKRLYMQEKRMKEREAKVKAEKRKEQNKLRKREVRKNERESKNKEKANKSDATGTSENLCENEQSAFKWRSQKKRCVDKVKENLPKSSAQKAEIINELIKSPNTRKILENKGVINTLENQEDIKVARSIKCSVKESIDVIKRKRAPEATSALQVGLSLMSGPDLKKQKVVTKVASDIGVSRILMTKAMQRHDNIVVGTEGALKLAERKMFSIIPTEDKQIAVEFWGSNKVSRPTGNKRDVIRKRIGPKQYTENEKHVLDMTHTEAYMLFKELNPGIRMSQSTFEDPKPFFVINARRCDRVGCCCRYCVEFKMAFDIFIKLRNNILKMRNSEAQNREHITNAPPLTSSLHAAQGQNLTSSEYIADDQNQDHIADAPPLIGSEQITESQTEEHIASAPSPTCKSYEHTTDLLDDTMCDPQTLPCINRKCIHCGASKLEFLPEERGDSEVKWEKYTYKIMPSGKRKLTIISQTTPHKELTDHLIKLLEAHPLHKLTAKWQNTQLQELISKLPANHSIAIHDYSENATCRPNYSTISQYIDPEQASLHISIIIRHATEEADGIISTEEDPVLIWEHFIVISPSLQHDSSSVHDVRCFVADHFKSISYQLSTLHEFTDGCSAQYKSRHCFLDVSCSEDDFGFQTIRNNFGTAHAKGQQDAAGGRIKLHLDMACVRGKARIQSALDAYNYLQETFTEPKCQDTKMKRRIFKYQETIQGSQRFAKPITTEKVRKIHCIRSCGEAGKLYVRELSCYCDGCVVGKYDECTNKEWVMPWRELKIKQEDKNATVSSDTQEEVEERVEGPLDMVKEGDDIAITYADQITNGEVGMFNITEPKPTSLQTDTNDPWGNPIPMGNEVLQGHFYKLEKVEKRGRVYSLLTDDAYMILY